jgi:nitrite reductase/ring-hydroxylating ferredoxin subunit
MAALQTNPLQFDPNQLGLTRVARYHRRIRAPLVRVWENVLDWEHLPHLHATSFSHIELDDAGDWGWRTWTDPDRASHVELCVAGDDRYVARSYAVDQQVSEIWTTLEPREETTEITVEFYFPDVEPDAAQGLGDMMLQLYARLWDEDEAMMRERHRRLQEKREAVAEVDLGSRELLMDRLAAGEQILFQLKRREYQLRHHGGTLIAHPTICPHLLGPLVDCDLADGLLTCPWHGYRFELSSGKCLQPPHASCSLPANASLREQGGHIIAGLN